MMNPEPEQSEPPQSVFRCDICGTVMIDWNCELICPNCGFRRDCSDP